MTCLGDRPLDCCAAAVNNAVVSTWNTRVLLLCVSVEDVPKGRTKGIEAFGSRGCVNLVNGNAGSCRAMVILPILYSWGMRTHRGADH